jgi:hypothetical protein
MKKREIVSVRPERSVPGRYRSICSTRPDGKTAEWKSRALRAYRWFLLLSIAYSVVDSGPSVISLVDVPLPSRGRRSGPLPCSD